MLQFNESVLLSMLLACLATCCATCAADAPTTRPVVVVELFTSEGCSSCPPADAVFADLAKPNAVKGVQIIPLAIHVDYWNYLGWADPYSSAQFSARQQQYARMMHSDQIYTPQMIVNGTDGFVGSDKEKATAAIANAATQARGRVAIDLGSIAANGKSVDCKISVDGIRPPGKSPADVMLAVTEDDLLTDVPRGENAGRTLHHTGVVRTLQRVAAINAADALPFSVSPTVALQPAWKVSRLHVVVFVQDPSTGQILASGEAALH